MRKELFKRKRNKTEKNDTETTLQMNNSGAANEPMNIIFGILVSLAMIGIIVSKIQPATTGWAAEISEKMSVIFDYSPEDFTEEP